MGRRRDVVVDPCVKGTLGRFGYQRNAIYSNYRMRRRGDDGLRTRVHNRDIVGTRYVGGLLFIGCTFVVTVRLRCFSGGLAMLQSTSNYALSVARDQSHGKQRHQFRSPVHLYVS